MRFHLLPFLLATSPLTLAGSEWIQQSPVPAPTQVQPRLAFLDAQRGYMVGFQPTPLVTDDGGSSWRPAPLPGENYTEVFALDALHAWALGPGGLTRTSDGGQSWQDLGFLNNGFQLEFLTPSFGWSSDNYAAAVTHDGGQSWMHAIVNGSTRVRYPDFRDPSVGIGVEDDASAIWRTTDGGTSWLSVFQAPASSVAYLDATTALAAGGGQIHRSTDAGASWQTVLTGSQGSRISVLSAQRAVVFNGLYYTATADAGQTWTSGGAFGTGANVTGIFPEGGAAALALDTNGNVLRTTDGGASWAVIHPGTYIGLTDLDLLPNGRAVAAGNGFVLARDNPASAWSIVSSGTGQNVYDIVMWDGKRGVTCGSQGTVCITENGGDQWLAGRPSFEFLGMNDAEAIDVVGTDFAIIVGEAGAPIVTRDGGKSWTQLGSFLASHALASVDFVTESTGWVGSVGPTAYILRTDDGGLNWQLQFGPTFGGIRALQFVDASRGYALNGGARLLRTANGGAAWNETLLPISGGALHLQFADALHGWIVGEFGLILRTSNGGNSWLDQSLPSSSVFLDHIAVVSANEAWVAGTQNTLLHTTDGGANWTPVAVPADPKQWWESVHVTTDGGLWLAGWNGVVMHRTAPGTIETYCTAKAALTCGPSSIGAAGIPSASASTGFVVSASPVRSNRSGLGIYGTNGRANVPFQGGTLCFAGPVKRTIAVDSGGLAACAGVLSIDFNAFAHGLLGGNPAPQLLVPGNVIDAQFWARDAIATGSLVTDAVEWTVCP